MIDSKVDSNGFKKGEMDILNQLKVLRNEELDEKDPDCLNICLKRMHLLQCVLLSSKMNGDFEICKKYAKELADLILFAYRYFAHFDEKTQAFVFTCVLITSDYLYYEFDKKDYVHVNKNGLKHVIPVSEMRVLDLIRFFETKNEVLENVIKIQEPKRSEILGRAHILCSKYRRLKIRYNFMMDGCPKHLKSASKYLKTHPSLQKYYVQYLFEKSSFRLEISYHFELAIYGQLLIDRVFSHDHFYPNDTYWTDEEKVGILDEKFSIRGAEKEMKKNALKSLSIFDKMRKILQENKDKFGLHEIGFLVPLHNVSKAYYFLDDMENDLYFSNMVENDMINRLGQHCSYLLGSVFKTKSLIYNKLGDRKNYEKMVKLKNRHDNSGSDGNIPDERNPMVMNNSYPFKPFFTIFDIHEEFALSYNFGKCKKKKKNREEKRKKKNLSGKRNRICSNKYCYKTEGDDHEKKIAFRRCSRCKSAFYCSKKCQVVHWKHGHNLDCKRK